MAEGAAVAGASAPPAADVVASLVARLEEQMAALGAALRAELRTAVAHTRELHEQMRSRLAEPSVALSGPLGKAAALLLSPPEWTAEMLAQVPRFPSSAEFWSPSQSRPESIARLHKAVAERLGARTRTSHSGELDAVRDAVRTRRLRLRACDAGAAASDATHAS
jgi:hypothetical protein